jgi:hypothetical protein
MDSIAIRLVKVDGYYVAADISSAWNLSVLGIGPIKAERNQAELKSHRRAWGQDFAFTVVRGGTVCMEPTPAECEALGMVADTFARAA